MLRHGSVDCEQDCKTQCRGTTKSQRIFFQFFEISYRRPSNAACIHTLLMDGFLIGSKYSFILDTMIKEVFLISHLNNFPTEREYILTFINL